jgi:hypothetical protein
LELQLMAAIREVVGTTSYHLILWSTVGEAKGSITIQLERVQMNCFGDNGISSHPHMRHAGTPWPQIYRIIIWTLKIWTLMVRFPLKWFLSCCEGFDMHHILTVCICYSDCRFCTKQ